MIKEEAIEILSDMRAEYNIFSDDEEEATRYHALSWAIQALNEQQRWIPITTRPMDEEERREWSEKLGYDIEYEEAVIYTQLPDDGQEVLVCGMSGRIWIDKFENDPDYGCCFEENGDMDGIVAWMPLPEPYKEVE